MKMIFKNTLTFILLFASCSLTIAQQKTPLIVGDAAPEIRYSKWLKGTPVSSYEKDRLYVLEFWATWCGPCIAAMPGLSEFARKHPEVTVIAYNVWEKVGGRPYESSLPNVEKFVKSMGNNMDFNVAVDNNEEYVSKNWLKNAGISGIPSTMLVKDGKLIWIGSPSGLEAMVASVQSGAQNAAPKVSEEERAKVAATINKQESISENYDKALAAKDYKGAIAALDKILADHPDMSYGITMKKFTTYLDFLDEKKGVEVAQNFLATTTIGGNTVANFGTAIAERTGLKPATYLFGTECLKLYISRSKGEVNPLVYDYIAKCYFLAGDYKNAVKNQQVVVEKTRDALTAGKGGARITKELVAQYEETLKEYQAKASRK
ncbi:TlpA family protein disulfide reductase [Pedobacter sp. MC2016-14]|uniref:TlpA family protein disulfide reductase n=1 Tax=Pedobacter sp. MC2016-14 TaxID=2897327 RepID=UPI001E4BC9DA|nr:TlpA disulfide reductase family protein [Pedobacter sp. MC2016-14]MCD0486694.1 TlpA family protein disulfide reductase [Pedobacter sp. MC2016-14]